MSETLDALNRVESKLDKLAEDVVELRVVVGTMVAKVDSLAVQVTATIDDVSSQERSIMLAQQRVQKLEMEQQQSPWTKKNVAALVALIAALLSAFGFSTSTSSVVASMGAPMEAPSSEPQD